MVVIISSDDQHTELVCALQHEVLRSSLGYKDSQS